MTITPRQETIKWLARQICYQPKSTCFPCKLISRYLEGKDPLLHNCSRQLSLTIVTDLFDSFFFKNADKSCSCYLQVALFQTNKLQRQNLVIHILTGHPTRKSIALSKICKNCQWVHSLSNLVNPRLWR